MSSIRATLTTYLMLGGGLFLIVVAFILSSFINTSLSRRHDRDLLNRAQGLITLTSYSHEEGGPEIEFADEFMPEFSEPTGPEFFEAWLFDDALLERSNSLGERAFPLNHELTRAPVFGDISLEPGGRCRFVRISFIPQDEELDIEGNLDPMAHPKAAVTLLLARNRDDFDKLLGQIQLSIWGAFALLLVLLTMLVRIALKIGLVPLEEIRDQVGQIDPQALDTRISINKEVDELLPIVKQLNLLLANLGVAMDRERRFSSNVAHELRTPLAELRTLSEVGPHSLDDTAAVLAFFADVREISLEMEQLVSNLLSLSRSDSGTQPVLLGEVDLAASLRKAWARAETRAKERAILPNWRLPNQALFQTDPIMMEIILQNLMTNAACYSPEGSTVEIDLSRVEAGYNLTVKNPAPHLEQSDLSLMFDRFWRKDSARTGGDHAGLGLSLVHAFCRQLDLKIQLDLDPSGQLSFGLFMPCAMDEQLQILRAGQRNKKEVEALTTL